MDRVRRNIMLPASLDRELETISKTLGEKRSALISKALSYYFDFLDLEIAKQRARRFEAGESRALTSQELRKALRF